jgi:hypothetical protein
MADNYLLSKYYAAKATPDSAARAQGGSYALANAGASAEAASRRKKLLEEAIASGKVKAASLGPVDSGLLGLSLPSPRSGSGGGSGILGGIGNFIGNLGSDVWQAGKYLPSGIYNTGKSVLHDVVAPLGVGFGTPGTRHDQPQSDVLENIVKPTLKSYGETYGHGPGHFLQSFYQHPLGPILDAASVVSLGASGAARAGGLAARSAEPGSTIARLGEAGASLTSREGRAPFVHPISGVETPREFTPRPVAKLGQRVLDAVSKTGPEENSLGHFIRSMSERKETRWRDAQARAAQNDVADDAMRQIIPITKLTPDESIALTLSQKGINTPERIAAFQRMVHDTSLKDPAELKALTNSTGVSESYIRHVGKVEDRVKQLILQPSDRMIEAHVAWKRYVQKQQEEMGLTPEISQGHLATEKERLAPYVKGEDVPPHENYPIEHVYVPSEAAKGFELHTPSKVAQKVPWVDPAVKVPAFRRGPLDTANFVNRGTRYDQTLFVPTKPAHEYKSTGETFATGTLRTDARLYLDHVARRARENAEEMWKRGEFNRIAARDDKGETRYFKNQQEVDAEYGPGKMTFVNDTMPQAYFKKEYDAAEKFQSVIENYLKDAPSGGHLNPLNDPDLDELLTKITEADAKAFVASMWGTMKRKGGAVPNDQFEYRMRMARASEPFTNPVAKMFSKWMYRWRTAVLTFMPRWGLNTALGSMLMNSIRGVNLKDYWIANRLHKAGFLPEDLASSEQSRALPTGVNLGHQAQQELMEAVTPGHGQGRVANFAADLGIKVPTQQLANGVQNIENYFRRAQFIHNLRREHRLQRDSLGRDVDVGADGSDEALGGLGDGLEQFYRDVLGRADQSGAIAQALTDPVLIERALKESDKMSYNYSVLGPGERRVVRQFIPFWGWYKFISMAAYRMPVELPGRMNLIRNLSAIAADDEKKYGPMPEWVKGSIPLGLDKQGKFKYLSTMGMNPFGQVFNPFGPQGVLQGAIQLGQFNPAIQAGMLGFGIDPLSGDQVSISPESGVGTDFFGRMWKDGKQVNPATSGTALQRIGMGLLRSFPEYRIGERMNYGPQYPESIPFIPGSRRQMAPQSGGAGYGDILMQVTGTAPKSTSLVGFQTSSAKGMKYAEQQRQTAVKRLHRKIGQP